MRVVVMMVLLLGPLVAVGWGPSVNADDGEDFCAQSIGEVPVGAGTPVPLPVPLLAGVSYVDVPFHACSNGGFWLDDASESVQATRICPDEVVRVWSFAGEAAQDYVINWRAAGSADDC